jgi:DNA-binding transcriptional LysR family regulator
MDWDDVRHFLALARAGSVRAAGLALGVSHSTVARRVEALEARLAARLFDRSRDGWSLTGAGARMVPVAERIERDLAALELGLAGTDERLEGAVALTCSDPFVAGFLLRELAAFCARHPGIALHVDADGRPLDLDRREADIAVRALRVGVLPPRTSSARASRPSCCAATSPPRMRHRSIRASKARRRAGSRSTMEPCSTR